MGTTLLSTSRARRKVHIRKVMRLVPEVVSAAPDDKLSPFVTIPGACGRVHKSLSPGWGRSWGARPSGPQKGRGDSRARGKPRACPKSLLVGNRSVYNSHMKRPPHPRALGRGFCVVALLLLAAGCSRLGQGNVPHVVGHLAPRTGSEQAAGLREGDAVAMTVEDFNVGDENRIEKQPITVIHGDTGPGLDGFAFQTTRLLTINKAEALLGATRAVQLDKLAAEAQAGQTVLVTPCGGNAGQLNRLVFCVGLDPSERGRLLAKYATEEGKVADITLVTSASHAIYRATMEGFEREYRHADRKIGHELVYRERKELDEIVARLGRGKPPAILFSGPVSELIVLRAGLKEVPVYFCGEEDESALRQDADLCEGVVFASAFSAEIARPRVQEFVGKFRSRTKQQTVDAGDALSADAAKILFDAAKKANSFERDKLRAGLEGLENYECLTGPFWFTPEQTCRRTVYVVQFKSGQPKLLKEYPPEKK